MTIDGHKRMPGAYRRTGRFPTALAWLVCSAALVGLSAMARAQVLPEGSLGIEPTAAVVEIEGISTLADFAEVERLLDSLTGVQSVQVTEIDGQSVTFSVLIAGGAEAVERGIAVFGRLTRTGAANARLVYQYQP